MFKVGDKIVCINNTYGNDGVSGVFKNCTGGEHSFGTITKFNDFDREDDVVIPIMELYETYTIKEIVKSLKTHYIVEEIEDMWYEKSWFISEKEYQKSKRFEKLIKLKERLTKIKQCLK